MRALQFATTGSLDALDRAGVSAKTRLLIIGAAADAELDQTFITPQALLTLNLPGEVRAAEVTYSASPSPLGQSPTIAV
ncbi:MAG: hypothetical protein ACSLE5_01915 [Porticoccaceae bacterium]